MQNSQHIPPIQPNLQAQNIVSKIQPNINVHPAQNMKNLRLVNQLLNVLAEATSDLSSVKQEYDMFNNGQNNLVYNHASPEEYNTVPNHNMNTNLPPALPNLNSSLQVDNANFDKYCIFVYNLPQEFTKDDLSFVS